MATPAASAAPRGFGRSTKNNRAVFFVRIFKREKSKPAPQSQSASTAKPRAAVSRVRCVDWSQTRRDFRLVLSNDDDCRRVTLLLQVMLAEPATARASDMNSAIELSSEDTTIRVLRVLG